MERENSRRRTRRKPSSPLKSFWYQKGRRYCAMLLSFCLILGNTAGTAFAAGTGEEEDPTFLITRADLYEALQKAAAEGKQPEENLSFQGDEELQKAYQALLDFDLNADLYELKPEIKQDTKEMELRIFACLDQGVDPEKRYVIAGDEKIIFLVTNKTGQEQEATIQVDKKRTEPISILPGTALIVEDEGPKAAPGGNGAGAGSGGATNQGGGSGSGGGAAEKTESQEAATEKTSEEAASPDDGKGGDSIKPEDSLGDQVEPEDKTENKGDNPSGQEEASRENETPEKENPPKEETKKEDQKEPELEQEGGTEAPKAPETDNGKNESDNNKEEIKADDAQDQGKDDSKDADSTDKGEPEKKDDSADKNDAGQGEPEKKDEASDKGESEKKDDSADKNDISQGEAEKKDEASDKSEAEKKDDTPDKSEPEKNEDASDRKESEKKEDSNTEEKGSSDSKKEENSSDEKEVSLSVSLNRVQRVASIWGKKASSANGTSVKKRTASGSNASPSNADQLLEGEAYETILLEKTKLGAAAFVTTASALGLDDDSFKLFTIYENNELKDIAVRVAAEPGDLPDNVTLRIKELEPEGENADQYRDAEEALKNEGAQYDGMMALDISFIDPDGNEVEPRGDVQVSIKVNAERLPEEVNAESLSVQHLKEEADGSVQVNQVADVTDDTDGIVEVNQDEAVAEFSVESFSTFTITWTDGEGNDKKQFFNITVNYVNEKGEPIQAPEMMEGVSLSDGSEIMLDTFKTRANTTLKYKGAYYGENNYDVESKKIDRIEAEATEKNSASRTKEVIRTLKFKNTDNSAPIDTLTHTSTLEQYLDYDFWNGWQWKWRYVTIQEPPSATIYLVYTASEIVDPPDVSTEKEPTCFKTATLNPDGTYDLSLSISGEIGKTGSDTVDMDILLIVDVSGSMNYKVDSNSNESRIDKAAEAVSGLVDVISLNKGINAQYSIVTFSSMQYNNTGAILGWEGSNPNSVKTTMSQLSPEGGTNYQAGIEAGIKQLQQSPRKDAQKIVIFLTDGLPTHRGNEINEIRDDDNPQLNINAATTAVSGMGCTAFYAVGFGPDFGEGGKGKTNLEALKAAAYSAVTSDYFTATDSNRLKEIFKDIASESTNVLCDHVKVEDKLSDNVYVVKKEDGTPKKLTITVTKKGVDDEGSIVVATGENKVEVPITDLNGEKNGSSRVIHATYDKDKSNLVLKFPDNYKLEPGWTYTVTTTIDATEKAYNDFKINDYEYDEKLDLADPETGTHKNDYGFFSNDNAKVTYMYNTNSYDKEFPHPVIQLQYGKLEILKTINMPEGLEPAEKQQLLNKLKFKVTLGKDSREYSLSDFTEDVGTNQYKLVLDHILKETSYEIVEDPGELETYTCTTIPENKIHRGIIEAGKTKTAEYINTYQKDSVTLKVTKQVTGNMGDKKQKFNFTLTDKDGKKISDIPDFTLSNGDSKIIEGLKKGVTITITESGANDYQTTVIRTKDGKEEYWNGSEWLPTKVQNGTRVYKVGNDWSEVADLPRKEFVLTMEESTEIVFINHKSITAPTGLTSHKHPYLWMLAMAAFGIMGLTITDLSEKARKVRDEE